MNVVIVDTESDGYAWVSTIRTAPSGTRTITLDGDFHIVDDLPRVVVRFSEETWTPVGDRPPDGTYILVRVDDE